MLGDVTHTTVIGINNVENITARGVTWIGNEGKSAKDKVVSVTSNAVQDLSQAKNDVKADAKTAGNYVEIKYDNAKNDVVTVVDSGVNDVHAIGSAIGNGFKAIFQAF